MDIHALIDAYEYAVSLHGATSESALLLASMIREAVS